MKIGLVTYALEIGGIESVLLSLAEYFKSKEYHVDFIETSSKGQWSNEFSKKGYNVYSIVINPFETRVHHVKRLANHLKGYDVLLLNDAPFAQSILGLLPQKTIVIPILHTDLKSMMWNASSNYGQWDQIACVSSGLLESLNSFVNLDKSEAMVISNGINVPGSWYKKSQGINNRLKVCFLGRVEDTQKGVLLIPEIAKIVIAQNNNIHFTIIGDGPSSHGLRNKIDEYNISGYFTLCGSMSHDKAIVILKNQDALLMPSNFEGHPIALLEAMSYGVVPVATNLKGQIDHVVIDGKNGYLCPIKDSLKFSEKILSLFDYENRNKLSLASWKTVHDYYSTEVMGNEYVKLINTIQNTKKIDRTDTIDLTLLGDLYYLPKILVRGSRKILRLFGLWEKYNYLFNKAGNEK